MRTLGFLAQKLDPSQKPGPGGLSTGPVGNHTCQAGTEGTGLRGAGPSRVVSFIPKDNSSSVLSASLQQVHFCWTPAPKSTATGRQVSVPPRASLRLGCHSCQQVAENGNLLAPVTKTFGGNSVCTAGLRTGSVVSLHIVEPVAFSCSLWGTWELCKLPCGGRKAPQAPETTICECFCL